MDIVLDMNDFGAFAKAAIAVPYGAKLTEAETAQVERCQNAIAGGWISARRFAKIVELDLDVCGATFERMGMENPISL